MDSQVLKWLTIMGLEMSEAKHLKMKTLTSQWRKMTLLKHPDKPGGKNEDFLELMEAYENLGKIIEETVPEDSNDMDEVSARKAFKDVNFTTENISSITVNIDTHMVKSWEEILTEKLGNPTDRTKEAGKNHGKQWIDESFKVDKGEKASKVYITLWNKEKKEKSTMLIQAEKSRHYLNVSYVSNVIPKMYEEVLDHIENENSGCVNNKKAAKNKPLQSPTKGKRTRTSRKVGNTPSCKICVFAAKSISQLNDHMISVHKKKVIANKIEQPEVTPYKPPTLSATQLVEISCDEGTKEPCHCFACKIRFDNYKDLAEHEKTHHEVPCTFCAEVFFTNTDLRDHVIKVLVSPKRAIPVENDQDDPNQKIEEEEQDEEEATSAEDDFVYEPVVHFVASKSRGLPQDESCVKHINTVENPSTPCMHTDDLQDTNEKEEVTAPKKKMRLGKEDTDKDNEEPSDFEFEEEKRMEDKSTNEIAVQTDHIVCKSCDSNSKQLENFGILEKEHEKLKALYEKFRDAYYQQSDEKQELNIKLRELQDKNNEKDKEIAKIKRDFVKTEKNQDVKINNLESSLK